MTATPLIIDYRSPPALDALALALSAHLQACKRAQGLGFRLRCTAERLHAVLGPRMVTTVSVAGCVMAVMVMLT